MNSKLKLTLAANFVAASTLAQVTNGTLVLPLQATNVSYDYTTKASQDIQSSVITETIINGQYTNTLYHTNIVTNTITDALSTWTTNYHYAIPFPNLNTNGWTYSTNSAISNNWIYTNVAVPVAANGIFTVTYVIDSITMTNGTITNQTGPGVYYPVSVPTVASNYNTF